MRGERADLRSLPRNFHVTENGRLMSAGSNLAHPVTFLDSPRKHFSYLVLGLVLSANTGNPILRETILTATVRGQGPNRRIGRRTSQ